MRDPDRIPEVLHALAAAWVANPQMRLTQLVEAAVQKGAGRYVVDSYYIEEPVVLRGLQQLAQGDVK